MAIKTQKAVKRNPQINSCLALFSFLSRKATHAIIPPIHIKKIGSNHQAREISSSFDLDTGREIKLERKYGKQNWW
jgi:hypothetical protein